MLGSDSPPTAAKPQTMKSFSLPAGLTASIVMPLAVIVESWPTVASLVTSATLMPTPAAM